MRRVRSSVLPRGSVAALVAMLVVVAGGAVGVSAASAAVVTVTLDGSAKGSVTSDPAGIDCSNVPGAEAADCSFDFPLDFAKGVKLSAVGADGAAFKDWTGTAGGTCSGSTNPCETAPIAFDPLGAVATFAPMPDSPVVATGAASDVVFPSAVLSGTVNPNSADFSLSDCYFEYGTSTDYGFKAPCGPGPVGSGTDPVSVTGSAGLLASDTTYHYRVVAVNAGGTSVGEDQTFTSAAAPADSCPNAAIRAQQGAIAQRLPDCYAYELVSPQSTAGQNPIPAASNPTGDDVLFSSGGGFADVENLMNVGTTYRAARTAGGWVTEALGGPPAASFPQYSAIDWTADWWHDARPRTMWPARPVSSPAEHLQAMVGVKGGAWVPLAPPGETQVAATDVDLNGVLLSGRQRPELSDGTVDTRNPLLNSLTVSYRQPDGSLDVRQVARSGADTLFPTCDLTAGGIGVTRGAVRRDGLSRVVFTTGGTGCTTAARQRVWVSEPFSETPDAFDASASRCVNPCGTAQRVAFVGASVDTERIFMTTTERLVDADVGTTSDLYEYNFRRPAADRLQLISGNATPAQFLGVAGVSDSGSHVYFAARGALDGALVRDGGPGPVAGSPNLYVRISGPAGQDPVIRFVGTLAEGDSRLWAASGLTALTADGRFFVFGSAAPLTPDKVAGDSLADVYRFDAETGELRRLWVSDPAHNGSARVAGSTIGGSVVRQGVYANYGKNVESTSMSRDGDWIVFGSAEPLVAGDTNGAKDFFLWDAADGSVSMVSDGRDPKGARAVRLSPDGDSIFITTASRLVAQHTATSVALYAVRRGGGFAVPEAPAEPCVGDVCQGQLPVSPGLPPAAGSVTFQGQGNASGPSPVSVSVSKLKAVTGSSATLRVRVPAAGRITVAGASIRKATRSATKSATYSLKIRLSAAAKRSLARKESLGVTVRVTFASEAGASASRSVKVTFKQPKAKKKSRSKKSVSHGSSSAKGGR